MSYWEKTVEYMYVILLVNSGQLKLALPLAGKEERGAGDAVFFQGATLILVEFKANRNEIHKDVEDIFINFEGAKQKLSLFDGHHLIVFAKPTQEGKDLRLASQTYFGCTPVEVESTLCCGVEKLVFDRYLEELLAFKRPDGRSSSGVVSSDYDLVLGAVSGELRAAPLGEYVKRFAPNLAENLTQVDTPHSAPSGVHLPRPRG